MKEEEFRRWLADGSANAEKGRDTRVYAIKTIERQLGAMNFGWDDLDQAWENDRFDQIRDRLSAMRQDAKTGGHDYRILMPESEKPLGRLSSWGSWLSQYGRFLAGEAPNQARDADRIRLHVLETYIEPSREKGESSVDVLVRDVNTALELNDGWPNICQALTGKKFLEMADVPTPRRTGAEQSPATVFQFNLTGTQIDRFVLEQMRAAFIKECPDFQSFSDPGKGWPTRERDYKLVASAKVHSVIKEDIDETELGRLIFDILKNSAKDGPLVRWQTEDTIRKANENLLHDFYAAIGTLARSKEAIGPALSNAFSKFEQLKEVGASSLTFGERINIIYSTAGMARPHEAAPLKISAINNAWKALTGSLLFVETRFDASSNYAILAEGFGEIFAIMQDDWNWQPNDWLDVQGFLWIAMNGETEFKNMINDKKNTEAQVTLTPKNLILYGPPGTGKTHITATEALRLCGEPVPQNRNDVMAAYNRLRAEKRIEFVTFHQSMSYEDFVEGRQPTTDSDADGQTGTGFRLQTVPGIIRRMAEQAQYGSIETDNENGLSLKGRQVFKMSIAAGKIQSEQYLFEEAIDEGHTLLGWEDIDFSDPKYADPEEILKVCTDEGRRDGPVTKQSGQVALVDAFRNQVQIGDILVVTKGNSVFRAIGEVTGEYYYKQRDSRKYSHRRAVRWLWVDREGRPSSEIYESNFTMRSIYRLQESKLKKTALTRLMNNFENLEERSPVPHVLILDEINRANISKVFGELITLIEPDKRLGMPNALTVKLPYSGDEFGIPNNLHIIGTMNTADRSIALLDTALRRRFEFREIKPNPDLLREASNGCGLDLPKILTVLNERIEYLYDREHQIGHAYLMGCSSLAEVDHTMRYKIIPLLAEYFFEDWDKVAVVLGDAQTHDRPILGSFMNRVVLKAPPGLDEDSDGPVRFRWTIRDTDEGFDYSGLTG